MAQKKNIISFHRRYHGYTGGHQKVRDYLAHTLALKNFAPTLWLENTSSIKSELFDAIEGVEYQQNYLPEQADIVFLAGMDWQDYLPHFSEKQPKVNLIQHIRHGDPKHPLFAFLKHKAIRLCVSDAVRDAILPHANGPCITIRMGYQLPKIRVAKLHQIYILATKQPKLGRELFDWAEKAGYSVLLHDQPVERDQVHLGMAQSHVALVLPNKTEGFFLPGIEAMALADWAIVPDCIASREYTLDMANIIGCGFRLEDCVEAVQHAFEQCTKWSLPLKKWQGRKVAKSYQISKERKAYQNILNSLLT